MSFDNAAWVAEMLAAAGASATSAPQTSAPQTASNTPAPASPLNGVVVPLSPTFAAIVVPNPASPHVDPSSSTTSASSSNMVESHSAPPTDADATARKAWQGDRVYEQWCPHIEDPMAPARALRGEFLDEVGCGSLFNGLSSDRKVYDLFSIPTRWHFSSDNKGTSIAFNEANFPMPEHHFIDGLDWLQSDEARDLFTGLEPKKLTDFLGKVRIMFVSTSCRPYAMCRSKRKSEGSSTHEDVKLIDSFFRAVLLVEPDAVCFEQVFGFALSESTSDAESPLKKFLDRAQQDILQYARCVFYIEGDTFLPLCRHRVYVIFVHQRAGGASSMRALKAVVKAVSNMNS